MPRCIREYINPHIYLGFRSKDYNIYSAELDNPRNLSQSVKSYHKDEVGLININQIHNEAATNSDYFISGPPIMIKTFKHALIEKGVPANQILTDDWE